MENLPISTVTLFALKDFDCQADIEMFNFDEVSFIRGADNLDAEYFNENIIKLIGQLNLMSFSNKFFSVSKRDILSIETMGEEHIRLKRKVTHFINCLWFAKDNSASIINLYTYAVNSNHSLQSIIGVGNSLSFGENRSLIFEKEDFEIAWKIYKAILSVQTNFDDNPAKIEFGGMPVITDSKYHKANQNKTNRIDRALAFLNIARNNSFLPLKISLYISVLECLFTKDAGEIVHKISERTAFYIGETVDERKELFRSIKKAYGVRSKFFHGQPLDKSLSEFVALQNVSSSLDGILRKVLNKVLLEDSERFLLDNEKIEEFYTRLVFQ